MKVRNGFVSNSSSSSFVVPLRKFFWEEGADKDLLLTQEEIDKLIAYGFRYSRYHIASAISSGVDWRYVESDGEPPRALVCNFSCNQDEVIAFLVKNNIPFSSSEHYGHVQSFFRRGDKSVLVIPNPAHQFETYDWKYGEFKDSTVDRFENECQQLTEGKYHWRVPVEAFIEEAERGLVDED